MKQFQIETWEHNHKSLNSRNDSRTYNKVLIWIKWFTNLLWSDWSVFKQWFLWCNVSKSSNYDKKGSLTSFFFLWLRWDKEETTIRPINDNYDYMNMQFHWEKKMRLKCIQKIKPFPKTSYFRQKRRQNIVDCSTRLYYASFHVCGCLISRRVYWAKYCKNYFGS